MARTKKRQFFDKYCILSHMGTQYMYNSGKKLNLELLELFKLEISCTLLDDTVKNICKFNVTKSIKLTKLGH